MHLFALGLLLLSAQDAGTLAGHTRDVSCVAISANGKLLASGSVDRTIRLWDPASKQATVSLEGHDGEVHCVAFSPDGKLLASGEMYKKVKIWDVAAHKELQTFTGIDGAVLGVAFSPDGKRVFAASKDNAARVWTVGSSAEAKKLPHKWAVNAIAVSPDGKTVATLDDGGHITLWDSTTLKQTKTWEHASSGRSLAFSADGKTLVSGGGGSVKTWDLASGAMKASATCEANAVAITPDATLVVVATQDNLVMALNANDLSVKWKLEKHERPVTGVAVSPDGKTAFTSSMDMTLRIWNLK